MGLYTALKWTGVSGRMAVAGWLCILFAPGQACRAGGSPRFEDVAAAVGLHFVHQTGAQGNYYLPEIMGPGAAFLDYDGDGDLDVFVLQGGPLGEESKDPESVNRLFRNDLIGTGTSGSGGLSFTDVTRASGVGHPGYGMGVAVGDYDRDGDPDLYVTNFGPNVFYRNNGNGTFTDVTAATGTDDERWSTSAAFLDYDNDGLLDLLVLNYIDFTVAGNKTCFDSVGETDYCNPKIYRPLPDRLFRNMGNSTFQDVTDRVGLAASMGPGLGVTCADFDGNGWIDVYVANDGAANSLWVNQGDGTFLDDALLAGVAYNDEGVAEGSMGVSAADFDNDGDEDLFMTHLTMETNTLYANSGNGQFRDETIRFGLAGTSYPFTGFGTAALDVDNDRHLDLFVANGAVRIVEALRGVPYPYHQTNQLFRQQGSRFSDVSLDSGSALTLSEVSRGSAAGDVDNDGDVDVLVANNAGPVRLLLNRTPTPNHWLGVRLHDPAGNRFGIQARVGLRQGTHTLWRRVTRSGSYLSSNDARLHFGLGSGSAVDAVVVYWPDGHREEWTTLRPDSWIRLEKNSGQICCRE